MVGRPFEILEACGFTRAERAAIWFAVRRHTDINPPRNVSITADDIWAEAIYAAWTAKARGVCRYLERRVHGHIMRLIQRERKAGGAAPAPFFYPWFRAALDDRPVRHCADCPAKLPPVNTRIRCPECAKARATAMKLERQARFRERRRAAVAG
jgi:hypothetical protein